MTPTRSSSDAPRYSVCITHYNQGDTLEASLQSILETIPGNTEVVIIDAGSNDGSLDILATYAAKNDSIRYKVEDGCNRGKGRDVALRMARGEYIIANYDFDQQYGNILPKLLTFYHKLEKQEGQIALRTAGNLFLAPKELLVNIGGYHHIMRGEDHELTDRLEDAGVLRYLPVKNTKNVSEGKPPVGRRARRAFRSAKAFYQIGFRPAQIIHFLYARHSLLLALIGTPIYLIGILAGVLDGQVYDARQKDWRETFQMSARPTYEEIVIDVPIELKEYAVAKQ